MSPAPSRRCHAVSALAFALVALAHAWRAAAAVPIRIGSFDVPVALSWGVAVGTGALAICAWRSLRA